MLLGNGYLSLAMDIQEWKLSLMWIRLVVLTTDAPDIAHLKVAILSRGAGRNSQLLENLVLCFVSVSKCGYTDATRGFGHYY